MLCKRWKAARTTLSDFRAGLVVGVPEREKLGMPPEKVLALDVGSRVKNRRGAPSLLLAPC